MMSETRVANQEEPTSGWYFAPHFSMLRYNGAVSRLVIVHIAVVGPIERHQSALDAGRTPAHCIYARIGEMPWPKIRPSKFHHVTTKRLERFKCCLTVEIRVFRSCYRDELQVDNFRTRIATCEVCKTKRYLTARCYPPTMVVPDA